MAGNDGVHRRWGGQAVGESARKEGTGRRI